jgi:hypothetical protein
MDGRAGRSGWLPGRGRFGGSPDPSGGPGSGERRGGVIRPSRRADAPWKAGSSRHVRTTRIRRCALIVVCVEPPTPDHADHAQPTDNNRSPDRDRLTFEGVRYRLGEGNEDHRPPEKDRTRSRTPSHKP